MAIEEEGPSSGSSSLLEVTEAMPARSRSSSIVPGIVAERTRRARAHMLEVAIFALGLSASVGAFVAMRRAERDGLHAEFERESRRAFDLVRRELVASTEVIAGYAGHLAVAPDEHCRSRAYARAALERHPSLRGLSWNRLVLGADRAAFEAEQGRERASFAIVERTTEGTLVRAADRASYVVVTCIEPETGNEKAIGFDLASEPTRAEALAKTFASRAPAATARIRLVQETGNAAGVLLVQAVEESGARAAVGTVSAVLRIDDLFARTLGSVSPEVSFALVDRASPAETLLFSYGGPVVADAAFVELPVDVADRPWVLRASTPKVALDARRSPQPWAWLAAGALMTALAASVVRSERTARELLRNVLPEGIAARLERGRRRLADRHDDVTVLFADIVGFTSLASELPPDELVRLLDDLFSRFDRITEALALEKIKTIGDCYMCVGGLDGAPEATVRIVQAALDMVEVAARRNLTMRIGVHRGPVISGVIGRRRLAYDLWGDTVNVASRMETFGVPGRVALSDAAHAAVRGRFACEPREAISMKGVGERASWLVIGRHPNGDTETRARTPR